MLSEKFVDSRKIALTFDVENDFNLPSYKGLQIGLPKILKLLKRFKVPATFFVTGEVAEKYPKVVQDLYEHFEVACHGYHHESFQRVDLDKEKLLTTAKAILEETINEKIIGFRAPYLRTCPEMFTLLQKAGFKYDSSLARFKIAQHFSTGIIQEFKLTFPNIFFRFPFGNSVFKIGSLLSETPILYFHPWEALDIRSLYLTPSLSSWNFIIRPDRWFNTGTKFLSLLSDFIQYHLQHGFTFKELKSIYFKRSRS
jgi:peptidoglycan/xylan/chitin deacetylase (PgdA/CDA1 family)